MTIDVIALQPIVALVAGILILVMPRLLNYIVAIYLIIIGLMGLVAVGRLHVTWRCRSSAALRPLRRPPPAATDRRGCGFCAASASLMRPSGNGTAIGVTRTF